MSDGNISVFTKPGWVLPWVSPDHNEQLGASGASSGVIANTDTYETSAVTKDGILILSLAASQIIHVRIGASVTAVATDQPYYGAGTFYFPIKNGELASFYNGTGSDATFYISLAK